MTDLDKLEELTKEIGDRSREIHIKDFLELSQHSITPSVVMMEMDEGSCIMFGLLNEDKCSVAKTFISKGTRFPEHQHNAQLEYIMLIKGEVVIYQGGDPVKTLRYSECWYVLPGVPHYVIANEDCWFLAITFPKADGWPEGLLHHGRRTQSD